MNAASWARVKAVFQEALDRPPQERLAWLHARCGEDRTLAAEVESFLASHEQADGFAERPAIELLEEFASADSQGFSLSRRMKPGDRLGAYEIHALVGAGGMGEVYRARDMKLGRDVAIKVLPAAFVMDS